MARIIEKSFKSCPDDKRANMQIVLSDDSSSLEFICMFYDEFPVCIILRPFSNDLTWWAFLSTPETEAQRKAHYSMMHILDNEFYCPFDSSVNYSERELRVVNEEDLSNFIDEYLNS